MLPKATPGNIDKNSFVVRIREETRNFKKLVAEIKRDAGNLIDLSRR